MVGKKRKPEADTDAEDKAKRQRAVSVSSSTISKAHRYRTFYPKYEAMHWQIVKLDDPPASMVRDLLEMRERLEKMKAEIYREAAMV